MMASAVFVLRGEGDLSSGFRLWVSRASYQDYHGSLGQASYAAQSKYCASFSEH